MAELPKKPDAPDAFWEEPENSQDAAPAEGAPALEKLRERLHMPKKPASPENEAKNEAKNKDKAEAKDEAKAAKPRIASLDELIRIAEAPEAIEEELLNGLNELEEPEMGPVARLPEIKKPAWLEEMEAAEAASQQQEQADAAGLLAGLRSKLAGLKLPKPEKAADNKSEQKSENKSENEAEQKAPVLGTVKGAIGGAIANVKNSVKNNLKRITAKKSAPKAEPEAAVSEETVVREAEGAAPVKDEAGLDKKPAKKFGGGNRRRWALGAGAVAAVVALIWLLVGLFGGQAPVMYEVRYPSGYSQDPYCREEQTPVQSDDLPTGDLAGARLRLQAGAAAKGTNPTVQLLGAEGELLYQFANLGAFGTLRGEQARNYGAAEAVWLCAEQWQKSRYNGYLDGGLLGSQLLLIDLADGGQLFRGEAVAGELYLTSCGKYCYFYLPGQPEGHKWLLFGKQEAEPARIICRSVDNWQISDTVYSFAYAGRPYAMSGADKVAEAADADNIGEDAAAENNETENNETEAARSGERLPVDRICFNVGPEGLLVELKAYEMTDAVKERWDFVTKESVSVPYIEEVEAEDEAGI